MEDDLKMKSSNNSATTGHILSKFETQDLGTKTNVMETGNENDLPRKTTSHRQRPQKYKEGISQQP